MKIDALKVEYRTIKGRRMVLLPEADFEELARKADLWEPKLPKPDAAGNYPADEAMAVCIARGLLRRRRAVGLSQAELARSAGIRAETLNRIETCKHDPSIRTVEKIDRALKKAEEIGRKTRNGK
jgi:DNA-binding XRE family transcriptional regulator